MSAAADDVKQDLINIEIDGQPLQAQRGAMVIEVADAAGIDIPRFCYHKKLSIAANCRMCLVEVEKVPKPLPACATPVTEGMKVYTKSPRAIEAQRGTMEFLLINHPLDCPICDQGGECDLQEVSIGYGRDHSEYRETKRVVPDKDIGPLIATEMTRCIHCTRCVRFGEEVAGVRELGATGRGENTRIGTYIEKAVSSELSGNVIDLCPVGALTSKPFRFTARAWEMETHEAIAAHDCLGSNIQVKVRRGEVMRVDPRDNEAVNECWLSDRDRFSYQGVNSAERLEQPMIRRDGQWQTVDWSTALEFTAQGLRGVVEEHGGEALGALVSPNATVEEMYLLQKLSRGLGSPHIDHRLRQQDFSAQAQMPLFPWLGQEIADLERLDAVLLIGSHVRKEQPLAAQRLRKAALAGGAVMFVNPLNYEFNFPVHSNLGGSPAAMERDLAALAKALLVQSGVQAPDEIKALLAEVAVEDTHREMARRLSEGQQAAVLLGSQAFMHPAFATLCALADIIARSAQARLGFLPEGANGAGAWLTGAVPHRGPGAAQVSSGLSALDMLMKARRAYLLLNVEPEYDTAAPAAASAALKAADFVVAITPYRSPHMEAYAQVMLPVGPFTETSGTFINCEGRWQSFTGVAAPRGEARPAWKVLRVLGNLCDVAGFDYLSSQEVHDELRQQVGSLQPGNDSDWPCPAALTAQAEGLVRLAEVPAYAVDNVVRRAAALQQTEDAGKAGAAVKAALAQRLALADGERVLAKQDSWQATLPLAIDERVPANCVLVPQGLRETRGLGLNGASIELTKIK
ncbi:MAG: NADH-quinone oxidoreductase subunit NuoG [Gammaproteobacteria bacterium]